MVKIRDDDWRRIVASVWITEQPPVELADLPVRNGPNDVLERIRSGQVQENEQDRYARRQETDALVEREARREARENCDILLARRGEGITGFADVVAGRSAFSRRKIVGTGRRIGNSPRSARLSTSSASASPLWSATSARSATASARRCTRPTPRTVHGPTWPSVCGG
jgi:hypothetical protein